MVALYVLIAGLCASLYTGSALVGVGVFCAIAALMPYEPRR